MVRKHDCNNYNIFFAGAVKICQFKDERGNECDKEIPMTKEEMISIGDCPMYPCPGQLEQIEDIFGDKRGYYLQCMECNWEDRVLPDDALQQDSIVMQVSLP